MKNSWVSNITRVGVVFAAAAMFGTTAHAASASEATAGTPEREASDGVDLPERGDFGYLDTRTFLPTTLCVANRSDTSKEYVAAYLDFVSMDVNSALRMAPEAGESDCATRFFGGQKVKVSNKGDTPIHAYRK